MMKFGRQSKNSQMNMVCLVRVWQNAVGWTQQHLIAVNAGLNAGNHVGRPATVSQKYSVQPTQTFAISPNTWNGNSAPLGPAKLQNFVGKLWGGEPPIAPVTRRFIEV